MHNRGGEESGQRKERGKRKRVAKRAVVCKRVKKRGGKTQTRRNRVAWALAHSYVMVCLGLIANFFLSLSKCNPKSSFQYMICQETFLLLKLGTHVGEKIPKNQISYNTPTIAICPWTHQSSSKSYLKMAVGAISVTSFPGQVETCTATRGPIRMRRPQCRDAAWVLDK